MLKQNCHRYFYPLSIRVLKFIFKGSNKAREVTGAAYKLYLIKE